MARLALFGGSFDPPHVGHQLAWLHVLATSEVDRILAVPCFQHAFDKSLRSFEHRLEMTRLAAAPLPAVEVCDIEREIGGPSRTLVTVRELMRRRPGDELVLAIGSDLVEELPRWYGYEELVALVPVIVVGRKGYGATREVEIPDVSSTLVRSRLARGEECDLLVPRTVREYIAEHGLYRP